MCISIAPLYEIHSPTGLVTHSQQRKIRPVPKRNTSTKKGIGNKNGNLKEIPRGYEQKGSLLSGYISGNKEDERAFRENC